MATKYDRVKPWDEKLKRLYNCSRVSEPDLMYVNHQYENYKLRAFYIVSVAGGGMFVFGTIPVVKQATPFKYWTSMILGSYSVWCWLSHLNKQHYEQCVVPYFEKYKVK